MRDESVKLQNASSTRQPLSTMVVSPPESDYDSDLGSAFTKQALHLVSAAASAVAVSLRLHG